MSQLQVAKHIREFVYLGGDGKATRICTQEIPSSQPLPNVGDQVSFNEDLSGEIDTKSKVFKITQRRFPLVRSGHSLSVVVFFISDELG